HHSRSKMGEEEEPTLRIHARVVESVGFARQRDVRSDLAERQLGAPRGQWQHDHYKCRGNRCYPDPEVLWYGIDPHD
ncbi:MAG TPA: hypothetical protein VN691_10895, partial [Steroidobacteraceae bacterium]|nr:hypothetical protein [Steroidobacteraceae bacterium]